MAFDMKRIYDYLLNVIVPSITWEWAYRLITGRRYGLTWEQHLAIVKILSQRNCIIVTWRSSHLTSYLVALGHFLLTMRWVRASHVLMNIEQVVTADQSAFDFIEATGAGVKRSGFYDVFNCERAVLLEPRYFLNWDEAIDQAITNLNKKYDNYFNLSDGSRMSCVEVVLDGLKKDAEYKDKFHGLLAMIEQEGNLTPAMFLESGSFKVLLDVGK